MSQTIGSAKLEPLLGSGVTGDNNSTIINTSHSSLISILEIGSIRQIYTAIWHKYFRIVIEEFKNILVYWLDIGIDGIRMDAIRNYFRTSVKKQKDIQY